MKIQSNPFLSPARFVAALTLAFTAIPAHATSLFWDGGIVNIGGNGDGVSQGGAGTWDTTIQNWDAGASPHVAWVNANNDTAVLGGTMGTVSLGAGITVGGLQFDTAGYLVQTNTLTFGVSGNIVTNADATLNSAIAAVTGLTITKTGSGTLTLGGNNTYAAGTTVSVGTLKAGSTTALSANSALSVAASATPDLGGFNNTIKSLGIDTATSTINSSSGSPTLTVSTALGGTACAQLFTGSLGLKIFGGGGTTILGNANSTYSGGTIFGASTTATRFLGNGTIGTGSAGAVTKGFFGTGTITMGLAATDKAQIYCTGATTINNALIVNTNIGDGTAGTFRLEQGPLTINGAVNANSADVSFTTWNGTGGRQVTVTGAISGTSGVQVSAPGAGPLQINLTLNNTGTANSYAGNTTITSSGSNSATLTLGAANQIPNGTGKGNLVSTGGTFNMGGFSETINGLSGSGIVDGVSGTPTLTLGDNNATVSYSGVIKNTAGTLALIKTGTGTQTLSGTNTYSGTTTINGGKLLGVVGGGGANSTVILNAATATDGVSITDNTKMWTNAALTVSAAGALEFNFGAVTPSTTVSPLNITGLADFTATPAVNVIVNTSSLAAGTYPLMTWGSTSGSAPTTSNLTATLPVGALGHLSLSGNTLNLVVDSTVVYWDSNGATAGFGTATGTWAAPTTGNATQGWSSDATGGTLPADFTTTATNLTSFGNGATGLASGTITVSGSVTSGAMTFASGSGAITLSGGTINFPAAGIINVNNTSDTISSVLAGAGTSLTMAGTGTLTLSGNNAYLGATSISGGTLKAGSTTGLSANSALSVAAGATLDLGGFNNSIKSLATATGTITDSSAPGSGGTLKIATAMPSGTTAQLFTGSLGLQFFGGGTADSVLSNTANTYSGGTIFGNGTGTTFTRVFAGGGTIGAGSPGAVTSGVFGKGPIIIGATATDHSEIYFNGTATINNAIVVNSAQGFGGAPDIGAFRIESTGNVIAGTLNANLADALFTTQSAGKTLSVTGAISGNSGLTVVTQGSGGLAVTLNNAGTANSYVGNTTISGTGSTLTLGRADQVPNGTLKGNLIVTAGTFNMGGFSETINGLSGTGTVDGVSGMPTLTVGDNDQTGTFSGVIKNTAGTLALTKIGNGTLTLGNTNTYGGATLISGGTLLVNGNQSTATGTVTDNATLGGTGTLGGATTVNGNLAPGTNGVGKLTFTGGLTFGTLAANTLKFELGANTTAGTTYDTVVTNTLAIGTLNFANFQFTDTGTLAAGTYTLISSGAAITGSIGTATGAIGAFTGTLSISGNNLVLTVSSGSPYTAWAGGAGFYDDANGDGVNNGLAWMLGTANPSANALALLPAPGQSSGNLTMTFTQVNPMAPAKLFVEYSNDLGISDPWHAVQVPTSTGTVSEVTFTITGTTPTQSVSLSVPATKAAAGKLFGRLRSAEN